MIHISGNLLSSPICCGHHQRRHTMSSSLFQITSFDSIVFRLRTQRHTPTFSTMDANSHASSSDGSRRDAQGHWWSQQHLQPPQQMEQQKKRKRRGNRKLQRFRARLGRRGFDVDTIAMLLNQYHSQHRETSEREQLHSGVNSVDLRQHSLVLDPQALDARRQTTKRRPGKRKRDTGAATVTKSLSQISISQSLPNKRVRPSAFGLTHDQMNTTVASSFSEACGYLHVPDQVFKQRLNTSMEDAERQVTLINTKEKLQSIRDYARQIDRVSCLKMKQDFLIYYQSMCLDEGVWSSSIPRKILKENVLHRLDFRTREKLDQSRKVIVEQLKRAECDANAYALTLVDHFVDVSRWTVIVTALVRKGQQKLRAEYERRKSLLQFDAHDYRWVRSFYELKPTDIQVGSVLT